MRKFLKLLGDALLPNPCHQADDDDLRAEVAKRVAWESGHVETHLCTTCARCGSPRVRRTGKHGPMAVRLVPEDAGLTGGVGIFIMATCESGGWACRYPGIGEHTALRCETCGEFSGYRVAHGKDQCRDPSHSDLAWANGNGPPCPQCDTGGDGA